MDSTDTYVDYALDVYANKICDLKNINKFNELNEWEKIRNKLKHGTPKIESILEKSRRIWKQKNIMEDAIIIYRKENNNWKMDDNTKDDIAYLNHKFKAALPIDGIRFERKIYEILKNLK